MVYASRRHVMQFDGNGHRTPPQVMQHQQMCCKPYLMLMKFFSDLDIFRPSMLRWPVCKK